jgi:hypothetical protein
MGRGNQRMTRGGSEMQRGAPCSGEGVGVRSHEASEGSQDGGLQGAPEGPTRPEAGQTD